MNIFWKNYQFLVIIKTCAVLLFLISSYSVQNNVTSVKIIARSVATRNCYQKIFKKKRLQGNWSKYHEQCAIFFTAIVQKQPFYNKSVPKKSQNSQENTCGRISLIYFSKHFFTEHILITTIGFWRTTPLFQFSTEQEKFYKFIL